MNLRFVARQLGLLLIVISTILLLLAGWAFSQWRWMHAARELDAGWALLLSACCGLLLGGVTWIATRGHADHLGRREALLLVGLSWIVGAALSALPYLLWAYLQPADDAPPMTNFADCYFEAMSGLTTTGATILGNIRALPDSLLLWRATTHWLGGLGIVVLFVAVLPSLGAGGKRLFRVESPGPVPEGVRPQVRDTARSLWFIYLGITVACILALRATGKMGWFDSLCHAFSTVSTGGLSTRDASMAYYDSALVDGIVAFFMILVGVNFALYYQMVHRRFRAVWRDTELRVYLVLKLLVMLVVLFNLYGHQIVTTTGETVAPGLLGTLRYATFTTIALHTGTGFCTADFDLWPFLSKTMLVGLLFVGGCAGSTAGGVKVIRFWIALKAMVAEVEKAFRPNVVRPLKVGSVAVDPEFKIAALVYVVTLFALAAAGALLIKLTEPVGGHASLLTCASASLQAICNVGPGLDQVGATKNYGWMTTGSKIVITVLMLLGRLEIYTVLVLFAPRFWRTD